MEPLFTLSLIAVGVVLLLLWRFCMRVVDTPTSCTTCQICYLRADDCHVAPRAIRWYRPRHVGKAWMCNICIYTPLEETSPGSMAGFLAGGMSWLAESSNFWRIAEGLLVLTIPSRVVIGANVHNSALQRSDDKTSAVTSARTPLPQQRSGRRFSSPAHNKATADSNSMHKKVE